MFIRRRQWHPTPVLLPGKSHRWRSLEGCSPWGHWGSDTTERLHFHFSLSCIGEGNSNPLWCSCLQNPRDWGAWWAAVYGVAQSQTWLKWLSSSSSSMFISRLFAKFRAKVSSSRQLSLKDNSPTPTLPPEIVLKRILTAIISYPMFGLLATNLWLSPLSKIMPSWKWVAAAWI